MEMLMLLWELEGATRWGLDMTTRWRNLQPQMQKNLFDRPIIRNVILLRALQNLKKERNED